MIQMKRKIVEREVNSDYIQFHFCVKGSSQIYF